MSRWGRVLSYGYRFFKPQTSRIGGITYSAGFSSPYQQPIIEINTFQSRICKSTNETTATDKGKKTNQKRRRYSDGDDEPRDSATTTGFKESIMGSTPYNMDTSSNFGWGPSELKAKMEEN